MKQPTHEVLRRKTAEATATVRKIVAAERKIRAAVLRRITAGTGFVRDVHGRYYTGGVVIEPEKQKQGVILLVRPLGTDVFGLPQMLACCPQSRRNRITRRRVAERLSVIPVQKTQVPAFGPVWKETHSPSNETLRTLTRLANPAGARKILG